jgi:hypothetical protein
MSSAGGFLSSRPMKNRSSEKNRSCQIYSTCALASAIAATAAEDDNDSIVLSPNLLQD